MEALRLLAQTEAELASRIESLSWKMSFLKYPAAGASIHMNQTHGQFCEDHWQPIIEQVKYHNLLDAYRSFCSSFESQVDLRVRSSDLRDKANRLYVDTLLRNVEESVHDRIAAAISDEYADVASEIQQALDMISTMREHFVPSIDAFRSELVRFKKKLTEEDQPVQLVAAQPPVDRLPLKPAFIEKAKAAGPKICKTPYKKRTRPYAPKKLGAVVGASIEHLSPRAKSSFKVDQKSTRYLLPF
jgi:hypothetical protein